MTVRRQIFTQPWPVPRNGGDGIVGEGESFPNLLSFFFSVSFLLYGLRSKPIRPTLKASSVVGLQHIKYAVSFMSVINKLTQ